MIVIVFNVDENYFKYTAYPREETLVTLKLKVYRFAYNYFEHIETMDIDGTITSGDFTLDLKSPIRSTCSLSIMVQDEKWMVYLDSYVWYDKVYNAQLIYSYINNPEKPDDEVNLGWYLPNSSSFSVNQTERTLSLSCTDCISTLMAERSGSLTKTFGGWIEAVCDFYKLNDLVLEGGDGLSWGADTGFNNYIAELIHWKGDVRSPIMWKDSIEECDGTIIDLPPCSDVREDSPKPLAEVIKSILREYDTPLQIQSYSVSLQYDSEPLPHDLEFDCSVSMYDVFKKIIDLYPNQYLFFDTNRRLHFEQLPLYWGWHKNNWESYYFARDIMPLVIDESYSVNFENCVNLVVVFGRNGTCSGSYVLGYDSTCPNCNYTGDYSEFMDRDYFFNGTESDDGYGFHCPHCHTPIYAFVGNDEPLADYVIGVHKYVETCDDCLTDEECFDRAKWLCKQKNQYSKTITVKLADRILPMYKSETLGLGSRVEYTELTTGETNAYVCTNLSYKVNPPETYWEMQLSPFKPLQDDEYSTRLATPSLSASVNENGLVTLFISSSDDDYSVFKLYNQSYLHTALNHFIGETCTNSFQFQLNEYGTYYFRASAYNLYIPPSHYSNAICVEYTGSGTTIKKQYLVDENDKHITNEDDKLIYI